MKIPGKLIVMIEATISGLKVVKKGQRTKSVTSRIKKDNTVVTKYDVASERAMSRHLSRLGLSIWAEEAGPGRFNDHEDELVLADPLDGTSPFEKGAPTSTVSSALYSKSRKTVIACVVGEPATGKIVFAWEGLGTWCFYYDGDLESDLRKRFQVKTSLTKPDNPKATIFLDGSRSFSNRTSTVVDYEVRARLQCEVGRNFSILMLGSNCNHMALVALGRNGVVGSITTCVGGPYDIAPGILVSEAGGAVAAFALFDDVIKSVSPLSVLEADFMITANTQESLSRLTQVFREVIKSNN